MYNSSATRAWQRFINVKSIYICVRYPTQLSLMEKLSMLTNAEEIEGLIENEKYISILQTIMQRCKYKIKHYNIYVYKTSKENTLSPLTLINAKYISINNSYFYIKWSNKCETLNLCRFKNISLNWCNYVINNCDCSNIKCLYFKSRDRFRVYDIDVSFSFSDSLNSIALALPTIQSKIKINW